ncbi:MAG: type II toxin-antitoxin system Phd/YefM family antitoxin [Spirochaetales bacterium]|nr:type II toxin-antitoxin system Phd/YefM family antitoxin [Spirochaetales bacterium]
MPDIRPISDLRNNFTTISKIVHTKDEPVFFTKNGKGDMVVMSIEHYEKQIARIELYTKLKEAEDEIARGARGTDAQAFIQSLMKTE